MRFTLMTAVVSFASLGVLFACSVSAPSNPFPISDEAGTVPVGSGTTKAPSTPTKPSGGGSTCEKICEKAASANCSKQSTCVADCEKDQKSIPSTCQDEVDDANACAQKSSTTFKCSSSGKATAVGCDTEAKALLTCITSGTPSSSGGTSSGGTPPASCGLTSGDKTCDTCLDTSCCTQSTSCSGNSECMAILTCFGSCNDDACFTACETSHPTGKTAEQALFTCMGSSCNAECGGN